MKIDFGPNGRFNEASRGAVRYLPNEKLYAFWIAAPSRDRDTPVGIRLTRDEAKDLALELLSQVIA